MCSSESPPSAAGAAMLLLETEQSARARGARMHAELAGFGTTSDAGDIVRPDAGGAARAMEEALAPLPVRRVDFPYRRAGRRAPDRAPVLVACVKEEVRAFARELGVHLAR